MEFSLILSLNRLSVADQTPRPLDLYISTTMSARSYLLMALIVISSISQSHATSIGVTDVSVLIFSPRESMLQAGHNSQLSRATHIIHSKCASKLLPVVVLKGIIPDENAPFETELARSRVASVKPVTDTEC